MKEILSLTYFEIQRQKLYWLSIALIYLVLSLISINNNIQSNFQQNMVIQPSILLNIINIAFIIGVISTAIATLLVWLKDWFSQGKMISRWLAGPFKRSSLYHAKFLSLVFYFFLNILFVYFTVYVFHFLLQMILQERYSNDMPLYLVFNFSYFTNLFTESIWVSLVNILAWLALIPITLLFVLLERAYSWKWSVLYLLILVAGTYLTGKLIAFGMLPTNLEFHAFYPLSFILVGSITYWIGSQYVAKDLHI
ncbi:hypothetical protein ACQV2S_05300 [Facklamia sp. P13064]|uniref:hypothetical protein n=1 Tax=unclassified Facklamia TaxID=2622293 RepID=UPI003D178ED9